MNKVAILISGISFVSFCTDIGNTSEYKRGDRGEHYENSESHENKFYGTAQIPYNIIGIWIIDGKNIKVTEGTYIDREYGHPEVGSYVEVEGQYNDNAFIARKIEVKRKHK